MKRTSQRPKKRAPSKRAAKAVSVKKELTAVPSRGGGWIRVLEPFTGAWQRNVRTDFDSAATFHADFACKTLIARDVAKLRVKLVERDADGIWTETSNPAYDPVLRQPNHFQTRNQFWENWMLSKLSRGNTYVFKKYNAASKVEALYVLDPSCVRPLVADDGSVFYRLVLDKLSGLPEESVVVPARFIIHDRMNCLFHPLVGIPPLFASALAAMQGLNIQTQSVKLFENNSTPGGILTAPDLIPSTEIERIKNDWEQNFRGGNVGRVCILGDGLQYQKMAAFTAVEGQVIEQLKWTAEVVCSTYHVPPYKIGVGAMPSYNNVQALNVEYYSQGLQSLIEEAEECLDAGLGIGWQFKLGTEFDVANMLRMDSVTQMEMLGKAVSGTIFSPNEARAWVDRKPVSGGNSPMAQHQMYSLEALAKRDAMANPFSTTGSQVGDKDFESIKSIFDAYGVGVRAGAITPQQDDESSFRELAGFPPPSPDVGDVWKTEPVRRPITLKSVGDDPALADGGNSNGNDNPPDAEKTIVLSSTDKLADSISVFAEKVDRLIERGSDNDEIADDEIDAAKQVAVWKLKSLLAA